MTKQRKSTTTFLLKLMPLAPNNSKWMPLAFSLKGGSIITAKQEPSSLLTFNTQTALAGKAFLAANVTEKPNNYHSNCISNTQNHQNRNA
jgi:hypothetical protein